MDTMLRFVNMLAWAVCVSGVAALWIIAASAY